MDIAVRVRVQAGVTQRVAKALRAWYRPVYRHLLYVRKQHDESDWEKEAEEFLILLLAALGWASEELSRAEAEYWASLGRTYDVDPAQVMRLFEIQAGGRLQRIAATTRRAVLLELVRGGEYNDLVARVQRWFSEARAARIASFETGSLIASGLTASVMYQLGIHQFTWRHGNVCASGICPTICAPNEGKRFHTSELSLIPGHPGCDCYPEISLS